MSNNDEITIPMYNSENDKITHKFNSNKMIGDYLRKIRKNDNDLQNKSRE